MISDSFAYITWNVNRAAFSIFGFEVVWYSLLFMLGFLLGFFIMTNIYRREGRNPAHVDTLFVYTLVSTIIGARLGHCFFYEPDYYLAHPWEILYLRQGGLASHGAAIGILVGLMLYHRKHKEESYLWILDRVVITVALGGAFIRLGNLMNSEIYGHPTTLPWGFLFVQNGETLPKHPTQIYEALFYFVCCFILWRLYLRYQASTPQGFLLGMFLVLVFGFRFFIEFLKEDQVAFESKLPLNMGQLLSIPAVLAGLWLIARVRGQLRLKAAPAAKPFPTNTSLK